jgi:hypothetical protein
VRKMFLWSLGYPNFQKKPELVFFGLLSTSPD